MVRLQHSTDTTNQAQPWAIRALVRNPVPAERQPRGMAHSVRNVVF